MFQHGHELVYLMIVYGRPESARYCSAFLFQICNYYETILFPSKDINEIIKEMKKDATYYALKQNVRSVQIKKQGENAMK